MTKDEIIKAAEKCGAVVYRKGETWVMLNFNDHELLAFAAALAQQATGEPTVESLITEAAEAYSQGYPVNFTLVSQEVVRAVEGGV